MPTQIVFGGAGDSGGGAPLDRLLAESIVSEDIVPSASNQQSTIVAPALGYRPVCRIATDAAVFVAIGANPNALTGTAARVLVLANTVVEVICRAGDRAAVVTAA